MEEVLAVEAHAFQGGASQVETVVLAEGRFLRKRADPALLDREMAVLTALRGGTITVRTPRVVGRDGLGTLFELLPGTNVAVRFAEEPGCRTALARALGTALREIHGWQPRLPEPESDWLGDAVAGCRKSAAGYGGDVIDNPASPFHGVVADDVARRIADEARALTTDLVFCHGDWCLPNALAEGDAVTGAVDWPFGGWADRRYDLATTLWSLRYNSPNDPQAPRHCDAFLDGYGWPGGVESLIVFEAIYALL